MNWQHVGIPLVTVFFTSSLSNILYKQFLMMDTKIFSNIDTMDLNNIFNTFNTQFMWIISFVGTIIVMYAYFYLGDNLSNNYFYAILIIFILSMIILTMGNSLNMYILGWDGLGVSSFLLVLYYFNLLSTRSALATFITNRMGDMFIIMSFVLMYYNKFPLFASTWTLSSTNMIYDISLILLILGAATKSAQLPFSAWLPAAMAAPTPVSALVHSSTLVTAGIFILSNFENTSDMLSVLPQIFMFMAILLSLLAGIMALYETDFKKLVAMSTLSQLGILAYVLFSKNICFCLFHIMSHATFKSLLFLIVGFMIFNNLGMQDARSKAIPKNMIMTPMILFIISNTALMGFIFSSGFFSKDLIILDFLSSGTNMFLFSMLILSCCITVMYSLKSIIILMNMSFSAHKTFKTSMNTFFNYSTQILFLIMLIFGLYHFNVKMDLESYTLEMMNKIIGVMIMFLGMAFLRASCMPKLLKIMNPTIKNNTKNYFSAMTNMNWISNNFMSKFLFSKSLNNMKLEITWWEMINEVYSKKIFQPFQTETGSNSPLSPIFDSMLMLTLLLFILILIFNL